MDLVTKHLPKAIMATSKGHLRGQQKNIQSTKLKIHENTPLLVIEDIAPAQEPNNIATQTVFLTIDTKPFARWYSDQTGRFPMQSF